MTRFIKITLIVAGALILLGAIASVAAYRLGGYKLFDDIENAVEEKYDVDVDIGLSGISVIKNRFGDIPASESDIYTVSDKIDKIEIDWGSGDIKVLRGGDEITVEEYRPDGKAIENSDKLQLRQNGGELEIAFGKTALHLDFTINHSKNLVVTIPADMDIKDIFVDSVSADIHISGFALSELSGDTTSGNIEISDVSASSEARFETVSGKINIDKCFFAEADFETTSGSVKITDSDISECLDIETTSGDIGVELTSAPVNIHIESISGDVEIGLPENAEFSFDIDSVSGDTDIDHDNIRKAVNVCKINTVSGDISIH